MKIYNTLNKKIEDFKPFNENIVNIYTCGPTVYHDAHIGNLRTYIFEDILEKTLRFIGYDVKRVMNITDVGHLEGDSDTGKDKMQEEAKREKKSVYDIADYYTNLFFEDALKLNIKTPDIVVKASDNIGEYIKIIDKLLAEELAYQSGGNIYFDTSKLQNEKYINYQKMAGDLSCALSAVREGVSFDKNKKNQGDFALWFTSSKFDNQEMKWDSPFGYGYPGWHIECSGIALKYLGEELDIHCGGVDNIFPHHSNEIAQSEAYLGKKWCNYWMHGEHLNVKDGKMSKSKGNFLTIRELEKKGYNPLSYRYLCLNSHYRNQLVFSYENLDIAENAYKKLKNRILSLKDDGMIDPENIDKYITEFKKALENDLNTSMALTILNETLRTENLNDNEKISIISEMDKVLSLDLFKKFNSLLISEEEIYNLIVERNVYKENKEFEKADEIRDNLLKKGIKLKDGRDGTTYEIL